MGFIPQKAQTKRLPVLVGSGSGFQPSIVRRSRGREVLQLEWCNRNDQPVNHYEDLCLDPGKVIRVNLYNKSSFVPSLR